MEASACGQYPADPLPRIAGASALIVLITSVLTQVPIVAGTVHRVGQMLEVTKILTRDLKNFNERERIASIII